MSRSAAPVIKTSEKYIAEASFCFAKRKNTNLRGSKPAKTGYSVLSCWVRVWVDAVPMTQNALGGLVEAVRSALAVADRRRQRMSLADAVFEDRVERSATLALGFLVVRFVPQSLQSRVTVAREPAVASLFNTNSRKHYDDLQSL